MAITMKEIRLSLIDRENLQGFLHYTEIASIKELIGFNVDCSSYLDVCKKALKSFEDKLITSSKLKKIFTILTSANKAYKTESHRYENGSIFEYSADHEAYVFLKKGSIREFNALNGYLD